MADITYTNTASLRANNPAVAGHGDAGVPKIFSSTHELAASASGTTIKLGRVQSSARIALSSEVHWDDLASSGSPTLDIGFGSVDSNITSDPDALNDGLDISAAGSSRVVKDLTDVGKEAWEFVNGLTEDPGGMLDIYASVADAATNVAGTVTAEIVYYLD